MAFQWNTQYEIQNIQYGTYINLYGNHSGGIPPGNVLTLWPRTGSVDQKWMGMPYANAARVVCPRDTSLSMNRHSTNNSAIMWPTSSSSINDTEIDFMTVDRDQNLYRLKLSRLNLYLTATGTQGILYWRAATNDNTQLFKLIGAGATGTYLWPLADSYKITDWNNTFESANRPDHKGIDIPAPALTPIYAIAAGTISVRTTEPSEGNKVEIHHDMGAGANPRYVRSCYYHNANLNSTPAEGTFVQRGQQIGVVGNAGNSYGNHLHLGTKRKDTPFTTQYYDEGTFFNPLTLYPNYPTVPHV